jgi:diguanylate cyclase (GGDEF)-like protein
MNWNKDCKANCLPLYFYEIKDALVAPPLRQLMKLLVFVSILAGLYGSSLYNYLLFHSIAEIFSIVIAYTIFIIAWNSKSRIENGFILLIGISFLFVGVIDLAHTLAYKGMNIFIGYDANLPTQLWIAARYLQSISILVSFAFLRRKLKANLVFLVYSLIVALVLVLIFARRFPVCYIEGFGLTAFKKASEYVIDGILLSSIVLLWRNKHYFDAQIAKWLTSALLFMIAAETAFTFYISVYGFSNFVGHIFKIFAYFFIYKAIVSIGIEMPHRLLFRDLKQSEAELEKAVTRIHHLAITDSLTSVYNRRYFFESIEEDFQKARRERSHFSVLLLDLDYFKRINDTFGHLVGDQVLKAVADCCLQSVREKDVIRWGGEEFLIILKDTPKEGAIVVAERLRQRIAEISIPADRGIAKVTASIGVATLDDDCPDLDAFMAKADSALYSAKAKGRNCVSSN